MRFRVTLNHNNSSVGDVFYTIPTEEEMKKAEKIIIDICNERLTEVYKANTQEEQKKTRLFSQADLIQRMLLPVRRIAQ